MSKKGRAGSARAMPVVQSCTRTAVLKTNANSCLTSAPWRPPAAMVAAAIVPSSPPPPADTRQASHHICRAPSTAPGITHGQPGRVSGAQVLKCRLLLHPRPRSCAVLSLARRNRHYEIMARRSFRQSDTTPPVTLCPLLGMPVCVNPPNETSRSTRVEPPQLSLHLSRQLKLDSGSSRASCRKLHPATREH